MIARGRVLDLSLTTWSYSANQNPHKNLFMPASFVVHSYSANHSRWMDCSYSLTISPLSSNSYSWAFLLMNLFLIVGVVEHINEFCLSNDVKLSTYKISSLNCLPSSKYLKHVQGPCSTFLMLYGSFGYPCTILDKLLMSKNSWLNRHSKRN